MQTLSLLVSIAVVAGCGTKSRGEPDARPEGRDARPEGRDAQVEGRDAQVEGRDAQVESRDAQVESRDAQVESRDAAVEGSDAGGESDASPGGEVVADFQLEDVNPASPTFGQLVSPRQYLGQIAAFWFGHSS